jgi:hypothetical protein
MNTTQTERLYNLLPTIYRQRDAEQGYPLRALLAVIDEQVDVVEEDIRQLYDNWFIETAQDWAVPYIGELIGYQPVHAAGEPGDVSTQEGQARNKILTPRREVANTLRFRRRKGSLALLEELSAAAAGWPARAVEFFKLLGWTQNINHLHLERARTVDVRHGHALDLLGGPYDPLAHTVDVRRINSRHSQGRYNIPSVGLFACRLKSYPVTRALARNPEKNNWRCYSFSPLGNDSPLFVHPQPEQDQAHIAAEINLPVAISRRVFDHHLHAYYGEEKSFAIWVNGTLVPAKSIVAADLSGWLYTPADGQVAVDPVRGQMVFSPSALPRRSDRVRVSYQYGFSADIGGGEYDRPLVQSPGALVIPVGADLTIRRKDTGSEKEMDKRQSGLQDRLTQVLRPWTPSEDNPDLSDQPADAVIEIESNDLISLPFQLKLKENHSLQIRAANHYRPVLWIPDQDPAAPDAFNVTLAPGSRLALDGLMIANRSVYVTSDASPSPSTDGGAPVDPGQACPGQLVIRHCTLVPGWGLDFDCQPNEPTEPSLDLDRAQVQVRIEHSILGAIQVHSDDVASEPITIQISDSILDASERASDQDQFALSDPAKAGAIAHVILTIQRSTVFGMLAVHAVELAENSIFNDCVNVARRQLGCMRFCYVPHGCRTPMRYHCQPDLAEQTLRKNNPKLTLAELEPQFILERERLIPQFTSARYGQPAYCQLSATCAGEIKGGADDESEMGVFHDLFQPQREANLRTRLDEYTPAGMNVGIIFVN